VQGDRIRKWLKRRNLLPLANRSSVHLSKVFSECLGISKKEHLMIIGDIGFKSQYVAPTLAYAYYVAAKKRGLQTELVLQESTTRGEMAARDVQGLLKSLPDKSVIILTLSDRLGKITESNGKSFRVYAHKHKHRFVSTTSLSNITTAKIDDVIKAIDINYNALRKKQSNIKRILDRGKEMHVSTKIGTNIKFSIKGYKAISADGNYMKPGTGGNLPAGEVYIVPQNMNGVCMIDGSSRNRFNTHLTKKPIKLVIKNNKVTNIIDGSIAKLLHRSISWAEHNAKYPSRIKVVAEFGIGMNKDASIIGTTIVDEKAYNTAHIAIGSNYWFSGPNKTIIHLDQVFRNPIIKVDGKLLKV
jgi:leucyl aminopeptidase (aminopeptidase T)